MSNRTKDHHRTVQRANRQQAARYAVKAERKAQQTERKGGK